MREGRFLLVNCDYLAWRSLLLDWLRVGFAGLGWPVSPGGDSLFFASPKKSKQKKGDPTVCDPPLHYGQPAVLASGGVRANLAKAQTARGPDPPKAAFLGADRRGGERMRMREPV